MTPSRDAFHGRRKPLACAATSPRPASRGTANSTSAGPEPENALPPKRFFSPGLRLPRPCEKRALNHRHGCGCWSIPKSRLPRFWDIESSGGERLRREFDYPESGPADVVAMGVPATARRVDRVPADDLVRVLDGLKTGRNRFDDYCGYVRIRQQRMAGVAEGTQVAGRIHLHERTGARRDRSHPAMPTPPGGGGAKRNSTSSPRPSATAGPSGSTRINPRC